MSIDNYLIQYNDIKDKSIRDFLDLLEGTEGKRLKELSVQDLSYHNDKEIWPGTGVYLFRLNKKVMYVGKVSSMSFTERIPKHFDIRLYAWMNRLLKLLSEKHLPHDPVDDVNLVRASRYAFEKLNVVLINFQEGDINRIERLLRSCTGALNSFRQLVERDLEKRVSDY